MVFERGVLSFPKRQAFNKVISFQNSQDTVIAAQYKHTTAGQGSKLKTETLRG